MTTRRRSIWAKRGTGRAASVRGRISPMIRTRLQMALEWEIRRLPGQPEPFLARADGRGGWLSSGPVRAAVGEKAFEVAISLATLGLELGQEIDVLAILSKGGHPVAALPGRSAACLECTASERRQSEPRARWRPADI